ncbi:MAG: hypothetical protein HYU44_07690 [Betaproteobacteria bacterium]|nr:hypothetical protein [Betaproteobacteria bacterium]MBI2293322.1 hypothetical protein [Betaproteobacteria bacterium]
MTLRKFALIALLGTAIALPFAAEAQPAKGPRYSFNADNTRGWSLMTAAERTEHRNKMLAARTYDECKTIQDANHKEMEARAKAQGKTLAGPKTNACDNMKAKGILK